jgi:hypothetical protein
MDLALPDTVSAGTLEQALPAVAALRALLTGDALPAGLTVEAATALLTVMDGVAKAASEDNADLNLSEAAEWLRVARPSVMRLIARGELYSRKEGGHYVLTPRELRLFRTRLTSARSEALAELTRMAGEFGV